MNIIPGTRSAAVQLSLALLCASLLSLSSAGAAEPGPSWSALPAETAMIARVPNGAQFFSVLRDQTRLGAVLFDADRWKKINSLWTEETGEDWDEVIEGLKKYHLQLSDASALFHGEVGFALIVEPRGDRAPLMIGLTWLEPEDDLAERIVEAIQTAVEEQKDDERGVRRVDLNLAGHDCMHLAIPDMQVDSETDSDEFEDEEATDEEAADEENDSTALQVDQVNVFVTRLGGRLLVCNTFPQSAESIGSLREEGKEPTSEDFAELSGVEQATAVFARFLSAHEGGDGGGPPLAAVPGMQDSLPEGLPLIELFIDPRPLLKLAESVEDPQASGMVKALGLDALGPYGFRTALDGQLLRQGFFLSAPAPRRGLLALLDQPPTPAEPPAWAPSSMIEFQQISFDLGKAYSQIKQLFVDGLGEPVRLGFETVEAQMQTVLKVDITTLLASLGQRHSAVTFAPQRVDAAPPNADGDATAGITDRVGLVWELQDEQVWQRLIQLAAGFAAGSGGVAKGVREQGFSGVRIDAPGVSGGVFVGRGHLVLGIGADVSESLLAALRTPPTGDAALSSSNLLRRARQLLPPEPCMAYSVGDASGSAKTAKQSFLAALQAPIQIQQQLRAAGAIPADQPDASATWQPILDKVTASLPTDDELDGIMGVSASQTLVTEQGMVHRSVLELPSP